MVSRASGAVHSPQPPALRARARTSYRDSGCSWRSLCSSSAPSTDDETHSAAPASRCATSTSLAVLAYSRAESVQTRLSQKGGQGTPQSKGQLSWLGLGLGLGLELGLVLGLGLVSRGLGLGSPASRDRASRPF